MAAISSVNSSAENEMGCDGVNICHCVIYKSEVLRAIQIPSGIGKIDYDMCYTVLVGSI